MKINYISYIYGYTTRNLSVRVGEQVNNSGPVKWHLQECRVKLDRETTEVLAASNRGEEYLKTLESLHQYYRKPEINTRYEVKSRPLNLFFVVAKIDFPEKSYFVLQFKF